MLTMMMMILFSVVSFHGNDFYAHVFIREQGIRLILYVHLNSMYGHIMLVRWVGIRQLMKFPLDCIEIFLQDFVFVLIPHTSIESPPRLISLFSLAAYILWNWTHNNWYVYPRLNDTRREYRNYLKKVIETSSGWFDQGLDLPLQRFNIIFQRKRGSSSTATRRGDDVGCSPEKI